MIKILFSDLDGTLLYNPGKMTDFVTERNTQAVEKLKKENIKFAIATSRSPYFLKKLSSFEEIFDTVAYNGNLIYCDGKILDQVAFTKEEIKLLNERLEADNDQNNIQYYTQDNNLIFYDFTFPLAQRFIQNDLNYIQDLNKIIEEPIYQYLDDTQDCICALFCIYRDQETADKIRNRLNNLPDIQTINTSERTFSITKGNRSKVSGIKRIADYYQISEDEIAVIGDSFNDLDMFEHFENSYCMAHAATEIQERANQVVSSVAECIELILQKNA